MADEDIGGIKIGITANLDQFRAAMKDADDIIRGKAQQLRDRQVTMTVYAKIDNSTFGKIERDLNLVVKRAQERNAFKFSPNFTVSPGSIRTLQREMARASRQAGGIKVPVVPEFDIDLIKTAMRGQTIPVAVQGEWQGWAGNQLPEDFVLVKGVWDGWKGDPPNVDIHFDDDDGDDGPPQRRRGRTPKPPPPSVADVAPEAKETGKAVASELKETPVKTEPSPKEETKRKATTPSTTTAPKTAPTTPAAPAAKEMRYSSVEEAIKANPGTPANIVRTSWDNALRSGFVPKGAGGAVAATPAGPPTSTAAANRAGRAVYATGQAESKVSVADLRAAELSVEEYTKAANKGRQSGKKRQELEARRIRVYKDLAEAQKDYDRAVTLVRAPAPVPAAEAASPEAAAMQAEVTNAVPEEVFDADELKELRKRASEHQVQVVANSRAKAKAAEKAAATAAAPTATPPPADLGEIEKSIDATLQSQDDAIDVVLSNVESQALRMEEMPRATPLEAGKVRCPFCGDQFNRRGIGSHIKSKHQTEAKNAAENRTPAGNRREELARAREGLSGKGVIGSVTPESELLRRMQEERREIGVYDVGPDVERLIGTVKRDKYGRAQMSQASGGTRPIREGGLLRKGLDPQAMRVGLIQPLQDMPEENQQALLQDPDFIALRDDFYEAIEVRRAGLRDALNEELTKVAEDPHRSEEHMKSLQEAIADPTAQLGQQLGRQVARVKRREELGITPEALTGFSRRDLISAMAPEGGQRPEGWEDLYKTYLDAELAQSEKDANEVAELDKALLKHRTGGKGERQWDFGPDIDKLRDLRKQAFTQPDSTDLEGWLSHAVGRGMSAQAASAMRAEVEATPEGERGDLMGKQIEELRANFGGPDPRALEEIQRLAGGPRFGEDISGMEEGDPGRTGLLARIRRSVIRGARTPEAAFARLAAVTSGKPLKNIKPREMELMEVAGYGAEAQFALDIIDQRRNQAQTNEQTAATKESHAAAGIGGYAPKKKQARVKGTAADLAAYEAERDARIAERNKMREAGERPPEVQAALDKAAEAQAKIDIAKQTKIAEAEQERLGAKNRPPPEPSSEQLVDLEEPRALSEEDRAALQIAADVGPASCPCGWEGSQGQYKFHLERGDRHKRWLATMQGAARPGRGRYMGGFDPRLKGSVGPAEAGAGRTLSERIASVRGRAAGASEAEAQSEEPWKPAWMRRSNPKDLTGGPMYASGGGPEGVGLPRGHKGRWVTDAAHGIQWRFDPATGRTETRPLAGATVEGREPPAIAHAREQAEAATAARIESEAQTTASFAGMPGASRTAGLGITESVTAQESAEPAAQVAGAAATPPPTNRWCVVCKRLISTRPGAWQSHLKGREHIANMKSGTAKMVAGFGDFGMNPPRNFEKMFQRRVEESVQVPPPELAMAGSNIDDLDEASLESLRKIAATPGGRKSLAKSGFTAANIQQLLKAPSARTPKGAAAAAAGGAGGATPPAPKIASSQLSKMLGSDEVDRIRKAVEDDSQKLIEHAEDIRQSGAAVLKENPVRALSVAVGQVLVQTLGGRADLEVKVKDLNRAVSRQQTLIKRESKIRGDLKVNEAALEKARAEGDDELAEQLGGTGRRGIGGDIGRRRNILARAIRARRQQQRTDVDPLAESIQASRARFALTTLAVGTVGIVGGTALFTAAMAAFSAAMEQGTAWVGRMTDEVTGFAAQANALAKELSGPALQTGRTEGGIRGRFALAGIGGETAEQLLGPITERVEGEVQGQRAILMRDTAALAAQGLRGQRQGIQNFAGNFQPTGGMVLPFFGQTNINAQPSVQETLAGAVGGIGDRTVPGPGPMLPFMLNPRQITDTLTGGALTREIEAAQKTEFATVIGPWNDALKRGLSEASFISPELKGGRLNDRDKLRAQGAEIRRAGGSEDLARKVETGQIALIDANGQLITSAKGVTNALDSLGQGLEKPDLEQAMLAGARQIEAAFFGIARNLQQSLGSGKIQTFLQQLSSPLLPFGTGVNLGAAGQALGPARALGLGIQNIGMRQQLESRAAEGAAAAQQRVNQFGPQSGVNPRLFAADLKQIGALGQSIAFWQTQIAEMQMGQQMKEYNRQVFVAQRNISDLEGLVHGIGKAEEGNIGILQRENLIRQRRIQDIQREGEAEALNMNQRSINFNRALANFTSSGATPAEAAARAREAELQAEYAQRQQDRQVEVFDITGEMIPAERKIVDEQNLRALQDAVADFTLFQDRFTMDQATKLMADNIALAQQLQAGLNQDVQTMLGSLEQAQSVETQIIQEQFTNGSETLQRTADVVSEVYARVAADFHRDFSGTLTFTPTGTTTGLTGTTGTKGPGSQTDNPDTEPTVGASGLLFNTAGTTNLTVGEAGTETVAVLRNPRQMNWGGGGGGTNVQVVFNSPVIRNDSDITKLALAVEEVMNRRARLYGVAR